MNLFTKFLSRNHDNQDLHQLINQWDQLEILVITIFKSKQVTKEDEMVYAQVHAWLTTHYPQWEEKLAHYWPKTVVGGVLAPEDPFHRIFQANKAADFLDDWVAMQNLAAAREALNQLIQEKG